MKNIYLSRATTLSPYLYCSSLPETGAPLDTNVCRNLLLLGFWVRFSANFWSRHCTDVFFSNRYRTLDLLISSICFPFHGNLNNLFWFADFDGKKYTQLLTAASQKLNTYIQTWPVAEAQKCELLM